MSHRPRLVTRIVVALQASPSLVYTPIMAEERDSKPLTPEHRAAARRKQIEDIVIAALDLTGPRRTAYLDSACGDDREFRREVESLLSQESRAGAFLETPALEAAARALADGHSATLPGRTVGPYRIDAVLGAGGMGEVYRGWDTRLRRAVALKFLAREFLSDQVAVERFEREARAASALSHPNVCTVYDVGEMEGRPFIAMEYLEGRNLRARLGGTALPRREALECAIQIAHGLVAAHQKGVVHRDLKPENLWVTGEGRIKILDFGLAKLSEPAVHPEGGERSMASEPGRVMGTAGYMSPEQVRGQPLDHRTDIFSFGAVLHEMISGSRTFQGSSAVDTFIAILNTEPPKLADPDIDRLVRRCLEKDPEKRFQSANDLVSNLEAVLDARPSASVTERKRDRLPRRRILQAGGGVAALGAMVALWKLLPAKSRNGLFGSSGPHITRLAVLPLANLSGDADQEYFADGMTEQLITDLGQIATLRVISRPSVMQFKGTKKPLAEIAKQLGVEIVIVGSVQSSSSRVRITAQLVDPATNQQVWAHSYERDLTDALTLQGEVARAIASEIQARVTTEEAGRLARDRKVDPAALDAYLLGRYFWDQFTPDSILKAVDYFEQAIQLDPAYAAAYGGLAECWTGFLFTDSRPWAESIAKAREAASKAVALDDTLAEAHQAMAVVLYQEWNWKECEDEMKKAIALNPGFSTTHMLYSNMLRHLGRVDQSIAEARLALEADPLAMLTNQMLGDAYLSARRYDLAIAQFQKGLDLHPNDPSLQFQLGWAYVYNRAYDKGIDAIKSSQAAEGIDPSLSPDLAYLDSMLGNPGETRQTLNRLLTLARKDPVSPGMIALVYTALDDREQALTWLEKAYAQHSSMMFWLKVDPRFDKMRGEPRFRELMRRVGLV
jgi:serine/threonine protein kinase/tetratricopeptide (TPR) repeat protein